MQIQATMRSVVSFIGIMLTTVLLAACTPSMPQTQQQSNLSVPNASAMAVLTWANEATVTALSYNFASYHQNFEAASHYFTPDGWMAYQAALRNSGNLETVIKKKLVVSAVATGAPVILNQGVENGRYAWAVQIPVLINYQSAYTSRKQHLIATLKIVRTPAFVGTRGLGIDSLIMQ